ncbi:hypothetical protein C8Q74DRAFT_794546 [Fomes fomentarius]|nr:hypothetical protein C8Q74DRAFT_794546 [Fomes fomentarius]
MTAANQRPICFVLHADPIGVSDEPDRHKIDWGRYQTQRGRFRLERCQGKSSIDRGQDLRKATTAASCTPTVRTGLATSSRRIGTSRSTAYSQQLNAHRDKAMPVIQNGLTTGMTVSSVDGLKFIVRYCNDYKVDFTALETAILPCSGRLCGALIGDISLPCSPVVVA